MHRFEGAQGLIDEVLEDVKKQSETGEKDQKGGAEGGGSGGQGGYTYLTVIISELLSTDYSVEVGLHEFLDDLVKATWNECVVAL